LTLPNYITLFRILLVPFFFTALVSYDSGQESNRWIALALFAVAVSTDALDGFLARVMHKKTNLGRFLDPLADKLLLLSGFLGILFVPTLLYRPPLWVTVTIVFRDLVIVAGLVIVYLLNGKLHVRPNFLGKMTTAFQMFTFIAILLEWKMAIPLWYTTAGITILSGITYVARDLDQLK